MGIGLEILKNFPRFQLCLGEWVQAVVKHRSRFWYSFQGRFDIEGNSSQ
jgi:hypothetical protein